MFPELNSMNSPMSFDEFVQAWQQYQILNQGKFRQGQSLYNFLHMVRPELAKAIVDSEMDPFYKDSNINRCLDFLMQNW
jgi:hypothetical protein